MRSLVLLAIVSLFVVGLSPGGTADTFRATEGATPELVTGHTVHSRWVVEESGWSGAGEEDAFPLRMPDGQAGPHPADDPITGDASGEGPSSAASVASTVAFQQRECPVWFNGTALAIETLHDDTDDFPSDEDPVPPAYATQDYPFGRVVDGCGPEASPGEGTLLGLATDFAVLSGYFAYNFETLVEGDDGPETGSFHKHGEFAVAVERGDCDPFDGNGFRFRGHLSFTDPNGIHHEVQEYDYHCLASAPAMRSGCAPAKEADAVVAHQSERFLGEKTDPATRHQEVEGVGPCRTDLGTMRASVQVPLIGYVGATLVEPITIVSDAVGDLFPWTYTDPDNEHGCTLHATPADTADPEKDHPGHYDLGHKCNGTIQDLFKERLWITRVHGPTVDATTGAHYTFAMMVDTCAGLNIHEAGGHGETDARGYPTGPSTPLTGPLTSWYSALFMDNWHGMTRHRWTPDMCADGSSLSFDDTPRSLTAHVAPPSDGELLEGNAYDEATETHRDHCRTPDPFVEDGGWPLNLWPGHGLYETFPGCWVEDHNAAEIDLFVYDFDPTGLFEAYAYSEDTLAGGPSPGRAIGS